MMKSTEIRDKFFSFFTQQGHAQVPSSPVIPADDPTLLFANAGMNQFKDLFLGREQRSYRRAVSIQKCIRAGGKHNDLDNVGFTSRHLTFFEMMGNFSFGDYFKKEAIAFAWDFLTKHVQLDASRLWASVYEHDTEAYELWQKILPAERIVRLGARDNFWQMGDTGPCGPCSEIYIDRGAPYGCQAQTCAPGCSCDRFLEIWNLVFMQFDRQKDGSDKSLALKGVDTGMGLERLCAVVQNVPSVFETDIFAPVLHKIEELTGLSYTTSSPEHQAAFRVLADHIRSAAFALADGCVPAADGRGYVLRKIIRRAALFAHKLSPKLFFPYVVDGLIDAVGSVYPELREQRTTIVTTLEKESEQFSRNLVRGKAMLEEYIAQHQPAKEVSGVLAFTLYDTYGFPLELTKVIAHDHSMSVDEAGFDREMERQRALSGLKVAATDFALEGAVATRFTGYDELITTATISILYNEQLQSVETIPAGQLAWVIPQACPFYVESGGQVSDHGVVVVQGHSCEVLALKKQGNVIAFAFKTPALVKRGESVTMRVDKNIRAALMKNHTSTHLLQAALMNLVGTGIKQSGSLVTPEYLRFDFTCPQPLNAEEIRRIEYFVNDVIWKNIPVTTRTTTLHDAQQHGVIAFFGEKYNPEQVRVVTVEGVSAELCGGTHVRATGEIGLFKIIEVSAPSTGNRRIVAVAGASALAHAQDTASIVKQMSVACKVPESEVVEVLKKQQAYIKELQHALKRSQQQLWALQIPQWAQRVSVVNGVPFGMVLVEGIASEDARDLVQRLTQHTPGLWVIIATEAQHERINFAMALAPEWRKGHSLKELLQHHLAPLGLKGGGSDAAIQGGAAQLPDKLEDVIKSWLGNPKN